MVVKMSFLFEEKWLPCSTSTFDGHRAIAAAETLIREDMDILQQYEQMEQN